MMPMRVAVIADYLEEGWPSMDLVADMLVEHLRQEHSAAVTPTLVRPSMPRRLSRLPLPPAARAAGVDRVVARQWDYARTLKALPGSFDLYHVIDHSYAHLVHGLPAARTIVTCHDVDAFRSVLEPELERRSPPYRWMARRILSGLRAAAHVPCDSEATRDALAGLAAFPAERLSVIPNGFSSAGWAHPDPLADLEAARFLGPRRGVELLHVGSTIPRKRVDVLLDVFAAIRAVRADVRLVRVGGPFTAEQRVHARDLGILDAITILPFVDRATLSAVYRRAVVALLPSEREGFGLPIVEALGCGTPMVASDIPVLREVGGDAVEYCGVGDITAWRGTVLKLLAEREGARDRWAARREAGLARAADFSWSRYAEQVIAVYDAVAGSARTGGVPVA
jgi:glycosyltransferase involved in cell wall biosynthesis